VSFVKPLADRVRDGRLAQTCQSGEPIYRRGTRGVRLADPCHNLRDDVDTFTMGARTMSNVVEVNSSTITRMRGTEQRYATMVLRTVSFLISGDMPSEHYHLLRTPTVSPLAQIHGKPYLRSSTFIDILTKISNTDVYLVQCRKTWLWAYWT
jgi:hypothetical protein